MRLAEARRGLEMILSLGLREREEGPSLAHAPDRSDPDPSHRLHEDTIRLAPVSAAVPRRPITTERPLVMWLVT